MSGDCTFNFHISSLSKKCANLSGWILRTFYTRDCIILLTLFKSIVLLRFDYGSQLWSPFLIKHISQLEKIQRSFTKHHRTTFRGKYDGVTLVRKSFLDFRLLLAGMWPNREWVFCSICLVLSILAHTSLLISGSAIPANKYNSST